MQEAVVAARPAESPMGLSNSANNEKRSGEIGVKVVVGKGQMGLGLLFCFRSTLCTYVL